MIAMILNTQVMIVEYLKNIHSSITDVSYLLLQKLDLAKQITK